MSLFTITVWAIENAGSAIPTTHFDQRPIIGNTGELPPRTSTTNPIQEDAQPSNIQTDMSNLKSIPSINTVSNTSKIVRTLLIILATVVGADIVATAIAVPLVLKSNTSSSTTITTTVISTSTTTAAATTTTTTVCSNNPTTTGTTTVAPGGAQTLWYMSNPCSQQTTYFQVSFSYIAQSTSEILSFGVINSPAYTYIDDVSVLDVTTSTGLLCNGGFKTGSCSPCWSGTGCYISTNSPHNGSYCIDNGATSMTYLQQTFNTTVRRQLLISFWTQWTGSGSTSIVTSLTIQP